MSPTISVNDLKQIIKDAEDIAVISFNFYCPFSIFSFEYLLEKIENMPEEQRRDLLSDIEKTLKSSIARAQQLDRCCA